MASYSVCSHIIESDKMPRSYLPFMLEDSAVHGKPDLHIRYSADPLDFDQAIQVERLSNMSVWKIELQGDEYRWVYKLNNGSGSIVVDSDYSNAVIHYQKELGVLLRDNLGELFGECIQILIECKLLQDGFLILHSACVEKEGFAYAFTGPSGIGKSTRAEKWCELLSAELISGDRPAISVSEKRVYGVPWDGKEGVYRNVHFPLAAIMIVKRSDTIKVKELTDNEKMQVLSEQVLVPLWDSILAAKTIHSLRNLIKHNPIYEVHCGIDNLSILQSAEALHKMICKKEGIKNED